MASLMICTDPFTDIDYSLDGRVRSFVLRGAKLYDEKDGTAVDGWKSQLVEIVSEQGLDVDRDGIGLHAFVYGLQADGLLPQRCQGSEKKTSEEG